MSHVAVTLPRGFFNKPMTNEAAAPFKQLAYGISSERYMAPGMAPKNMAASDG